MKFRIVLAIVTLGACLAAAPVPAPIPAPNYPATPATRDGSAGFDFEFGTWRTHYRLLRKRLAGSHDWYDCYGTSIVRPFWGGNGNLEDGDLKCAHRYIGGMTFRTYNATTRQWSIWWGTRELGVAPPPQYGHFDSNGVGRFYAYDTWHGTPVICRFQWTRIDGNPHFEQAYSVDKGRTWETNWTTDYTRVDASAPGVWNANDPAAQQRGGFGFLAGTWTIRSMQLNRPFANDAHWSACDGRSVVTPFWGGSADLEDAQIRCGTSASRVAALRLYDAGQQRWMLYSATQAGGLATGLPQVGRFDASGNGVFVSTATLDGRAVLIRQRWSAREGHPYFERAFSFDGGRTWRTNWTVDYLRRAG